MGSKAKIAKSLLNLMLKNRAANQAFVEPFVGGCNVIDKVEGLRIGCDSHDTFIKFLGKVSLQKILTVINN